MVRWLSHAIVIAFVVALLGGCGGMLPWEIKYGSGLPPGEPPAGDEHGNTSPPEAGTTTTGSGSGTGSGTGGDATVPQVQTGMVLVPGG